MMTDVCPSAGYDPGAFNLVGRRARARLPTAPFPDLFPSCQPLIGAKKLQPCWQRRKAAMLVPLTPVSQWSGGDSRVGPQSSVSG